jgi:hypothetical protein
MQCDCKVKEDCEFWNKDCQDFSLDLKKKKKFRAFVGTLLFMIMVFHVIIAGTVVYAIFCNGSCETIKLKFGSQKMLNYGELYRHHGMYNKSWGETEIPIGGVRE